MPRRQTTEDSIRNDRWVISYADFITLLFAFFVVMYAISSVNEEKYKNITEALSGVFVGLDQAIEVNPAPGEGKSESGFAIFIGGKTDVDVPEVTISPPDQEETDVLKTIYDEMTVSFANLISDGKIRVTGNDLWLSIELRANYLFPSGGALPAIEADELLEKIAMMLKERENPIHVEGFTDNQPISTDEFPSNWELSAARAAAVVRLLGRFGVNPERMAAVGYGEFQPAYSNRTVEGQRLNRRVLIVVSRDEKVRRTVSSFGSQQVSADAVSTVLTQPEKDATPVIEQVETGTGVIYRQAEPDTPQQEDK